MLRHRPVLALVVLSLLAPLAAGLPSLARTIAPGAAPFNGVQLALADFRGDGGIEVVAQSDNGNVYVVDPASGATLATFAPGNAGCTSSCYSFEGVTGPINAPVIADLDGNGKLDVVVADTAAVVARFEIDTAHSDATRLAFTKLWEHHLSNYQSFTTMDATPAVADLNGDGKLDVVAVTEEQGIFALRSDGSTLWSLNAVGGHASPSVRDIDGDGKPEVVVARDDGIVVAYSGASGAQKWSFNAGSYVWPASIPMAPTLSDISGDGKPDVIFAARDAHDSTNYANDHFVLFALDSWGHLLWKAQPSWGAPLSHTRPVVVSVNGAKAVLGGDWNTIGHKPGNFEQVGPGHVFLFDATGHEKWHRDLNAAVSDKDIVVADVLGDGTQQVVAAGTQNGATGLLLIDLATGAVKGFLDTATPTRSLAAVGDLLGGGHFAMAVAGSSGGAGVIQIWSGDQGVNSMFPGWGAIKVPHNAAWDATTPPPPGGGGAFNATFSPKGNEWWIETTVSADRTIASVTATVDGSAPANLPRTSWGSWAASLHAPAGSIVRFQAMDGSGNVATSGCYQWTAATPVDCAGGGTTTPPPPPGAFTATFGPKGNEWWVETSVTSGTAVARVQAFVGSNAPVDLPKDSWGTWAKSLHAPSGTVVHFAAFDGAGNEADSPCYAWVTFQTVACPGGSGGTTSPPPPPSGNFTATFTPRNGNEWWIQVHVTASAPLQAVDARINGGSWQHLTLQSYGDWAGSYHAPSGSTVEFRATSTSGDQAFSSSYVWPVT